MAQQYWLKKDNLMFVGIIAAIAALGGFLFGYDTGIVSGALIFIRQSFVITLWQQEMIVSSVILGALIGALTSGRLADKFGRRKMLQAAATAFIIGTILSAFAPGISLLTLGRLIVGLAIGISSYTTPLFISEMAPAHFRGGLVLLNAIAITGGEAISFLVDYLLVPTHSWRLMFLSGLIPAVLLFIGMLFLPSTPRWMVLKGLLSDAYRTLAKIRQTSQVRPEFKAIKQSLEARGGTWTQLFSKRLRPVLIIGLFLGVLQQFVGINTVMYYGPTIFADAGFNNVTTQILATFIMGVVNTVASILAVIIVDILGRRSLLITGLVIAGVSLFIIGLNFMFKLDSHIMHWLTIIFMIVYIAGYCISIGSLFWLIISEIYPLETRGLAMSFVTAVQWLANFIVAVSFLSLLHIFGSANTFWLFGFICLLGAIMAYFIVPETRGVSLEQIEKNLNHGKSKRNLGLVA